MKLQFSPQKIDYWAGRYSYQGEDKKLISLTSEIRKRKYLDKEQLHVICKWKSPRSHAHALNNKDEFVKEASKCPNLIGIRVWISNCSNGLCALANVLIPSISRRHFSRFLRYPFSTVVSFS